MVVEVHRTCINIEADNNTITNIILKGQEMKDTLIKTKEFMKKLMKMR